MAENDIVQLNAEKISNLTGFAPAAIALIKNTVAKGTTDTELAFFLTAAKSVNLNPLNKEIWCYKDSKGNVLVFAGRDGFLKRAQESSLWNGMTSFEVCENDFFEMDVPKGIVEHKPKFKDRGKIIGAYCIIKPKGCEFPTVEWAEFSVYNKGYNVWKSDPASMIKKVAETHGLKKAFGITIIQSEYDFDVKDNVVIPIGELPKSELEIAKKKIIDALDAYKGADKNKLQGECVIAQNEGKFDLLFASLMANKIGIEL
jgi:recombination protein RecT